MELKDKAFETYPAIGNGTRPTLQLVTVVTLSDAQEILEAKEKEITRLNNALKMVNSWSNEVVYLLRKSQPQKCLGWVEWIGDCGKLDCDFCRIEKSINAIEK